MRKLRRRNTTLGKNISMVVIWPNLCVFKKMPSIKSRPCSKIFRLVGKLYKSKKYDKHELDISNVEDIEKRF